MREEFIKKNPMNAVPTIKKSNYLAKQNKELLPVCETITVFTDDEIEKFKAEAYKKYPSGKPKHNQASAYILMLNTGLRTAEALGLINSDIDLEKKVMHIQRGVKEAQKRDGTERKSGREIIVGKLKTASSKRIVPLNETAIQAIIELRNERYFGEDAPLIPDADGNFTRPLNLRKRFYSILDAAGIEKKGLHSLRHTFATKLVTGVRAEDGTVKALTPRQVADLLGHTTSEITEIYYVKRNTDMLMGVTNGFEL
jgi:integrase